MNVLILTPDRVGSTLLQRLITVYMNFHEFDRPVINLHELSNGLMKYYNPAYQREVLGKPNGRPWGYYQSLDDITELLNSADHYKTSRLAHYHIRNRADSLEQQIPFYNYLNENFFIIQARRQNLLEHALSWCIYNETKQLNVYSQSEKIQTLGTLYRNKITVDTGIMINYLFKYKAYLEWVDQHFVVSRQFEYEQHLPDIEKYILDLGIFRNQPKKINWSEHFGIDFQQWNRCHYLLSDLSGISQQLPAPDKMLQLEHSHSSHNNIQLQSIAQHDISLSLSSADQDFLLKHGPKYQTVQQAIAELVERKTLTTPIPIKLNTLLEKRLLIKNFDQCVAAYNQSMSDPHSKICGLSDVYSDQDIDQQAQTEINQWHTRPQLT
jgi:hypothetical protein